MECGSVVKYLLEDASEGLDMWLIIKTYGLEFYPKYHTWTLMHMNTYKWTPKILSLGDHLVDGKVKGST